jgi:hypothetical protein
MAKRKYSQISLKEKERIIGIMSRPENINSKTGNPNFYKLRNSLDDGRVGHTRQKLEKWWKHRENIRSFSHKYNRKRKKTTYKAYHSEMESKLKDWIIQERSLGVCICGFVIRVKALDLERSFCEQMNKPCLFKASTGLMLNLLLKFFPEHKYT